MRRRALFALTILPTAARGRAAWPARPIRIVNPFLAGSPGAMARFVAERLAPALGQPVLIESHSGAGGTIGAEAVAHAPPDGHVLGLSSVGPLPREERDQCAASYRRLSGPEVQGVNERPSCAVRPAGAATFAGTA